MKILVAKVIKPQGIKGELKLSCLLDNPEQFKNFKYLYLGEKRMEIVSIRPSSNCVFVNFDCVKDRNFAETLRDWDVFADREQINLPKGSYLIADLLGCIVSLDNGTELGELTDVIQNGAADVYCVTTPKGKEVQFPFLKDLVVEVNVDKRSIIIKKTRFDEVCLYED